MTHTTPCNAAKRAGRLNKAEQFYKASEFVRELVDDDELNDACVTLCVHAGIAAADVICCAALGEHAAGQDHTADVNLLKQATRDADLPRSLAALLGVKTLAGYASDLTSSETRRRSARAAERLLREARRLHGSMG
jgi:hypothetical protein